MKTKVLVAVGLSAFLCVAAFFIAFGSHFIFKSKTQARLDSLAYTKLLELDNGTAPDLKLALQMVRSPAVIAHMQDPDDKEMRKLAFDEFRTFQNSFQSHRTFWISDYDLKYYSNMEFIYDVDRSNPGNAWYDMTLRSGDDYQFYVDYDIGLKKTLMWINALVYAPGRKPVGIAGTGIEISDFVDMMYARLEKGVTMYMYNARKEISGSDHVQYLENKTQITSVMPELKGVEDLTPKERSHFSTWNGEYVIQPLNQVGWTMVMFVPYSFKAMVENSALPLAVILIVIMFALVIFAIRRIISPLVVIRNAMNEIASGEADLTSRINTNFLTPFKVIPQIAIGFNTFVSNLQVLVSGLKASETSLSAVSSDMKENAETTAESIDNITHSIGSVRSQMDSQVSGISETSRVVQDVSNEMTSLTSLIDTQAASIGETSASVEELVGSIVQITSSMEEMAASFGTLDSEARTGVEKQSKVNDRILQIETQSQMLQDANAAIASIAEQTNLLAMNAAIEAAHAGEAGKGFAVVADEIRKLSETSSTQSKTIGDQLNRIQNTIGTVVEATQRGVQGYAHLANEIHETDNLVRQIKAAMTEEQEGSAQITQALHDMNESSKEVQYASKEMNQGSRAIMEEMGRLKNETASMKQGMDEMSASASKINSVGTSLSDISKLMEDSIGKMGMQVDQFEV